MAPHLHKPGETTDPRVLGGKAAALASLHAADLAIPPWFVVAGSTDLGRDGVQEEIRDACRALAPDGRPLAIRSSAVDEDGRENSFAGQLDSFLNVAPNEALARIRDVRASGAGPRVREYRRERGLTGEAPTPAVLIQRMVRAQWSGVAFAVDPVTGDDSVAVIGAVQGLGDSLVSGERDADTFRVDRAGRTLHFESAASGEASGMPERFLARIADMVRRVSVLRGSPQDIEWAVEGEELHLLQARPITTLGRKPPRRAGTRAGDESAAHLVIWDNSNIAESYGGITLPLTFSFARGAYEEVYRSFCRVMGVPREVIDDSDHVYANMLGLIQGRVYYNLLNWYRLIAMLPGYRFNRRFMEQMMGVSASLSEELAVAIRRSRSTTRLVDLWRLVRSVFGLEIRRRRLPRMIRNFYVRLDESLARDSSELDGMQADELVASYRELQSKLLRRWDAPIFNDFLAMVFHGLLRSLCARWIDGGGESLHNDLVRGVGGVVSVEPAARLRRMAESIKGDEALVRVLQNASVPEMLAALESRPLLLAQYREYLEKFADRCLEELKLESPTLADDPTTLLRCVGHMASRLREGAPPDSGDDEAGERARHLVRERLRWRPLRRLLFAWVTRNARDRVRDRENLRFERTRVFGRVRRVFVALGERLAERGLIDQARDIFSLQVEEVLGFVEGTAATLDLRSLVALRRREYARHAEEPPPPDRFGTRGMVHPLEVHARAKDTLTGDAHARRGIGCCAGRVRGIARVIRDPRGAELRPGEVLVAERTDPGWVMLFPASSGILVERGSLLSHSAIVSRELGIPGVVSIPGLTTWLRDGDEVEFDGATGLVRLVGRGGEPPGGAA